MSASCPIALFCLFALAAVPARAQGSGSDPDALKASVLQVLSLATFGMVSTDDQQATVTQDGSDYRVRLKLSGFQAPADAAITAVARPLDHGRVGIQSMAFPSSGTVETTQANGLINRISFTLGRQTISAKVDPSLSTESSYAADFGDVRLKTAQGEQRGEQTFDHIAADGTFSAGPDGRLTFVAQSRGTGFHMIGHGPNDFESDTSARAIAGHSRLKVSIARRVPACWLLSADWSPPIRRRVPSRSRRPRPARLRNNVGNWVRCWTPQTDC
jgi:hypothetical protein